MSLQNIFYILAVIYFIVSIGVFVVFIALILTIKNAITQTQRSIHEKIHNLNIFQKIPELIKLFLSLKQRSSRKKKD